LVHRSEFFYEDGSLQEVRKINEMYATLQEELKVGQAYLLIQLLSPVLQNQIKQRVHSLPLNEKQSCVLEAHIERSGSSICC